MDEADRAREIAVGPRRRPPLATPPVVVPDADADSWLEVGEQVLARRFGVTLDRREPAACDRPPSGDLYVTSERLVLMGATRASIALAEIEEAALVRGNLVLLLHDGVGVTIRCDRPQVLRREIAAARALRNDAAALAGVGQRSPR